MHSVAIDAQQEYISTEGSNVKKRFNRQDAIRQVVREKSIKTQRALVEELPSVLIYSCCASIATECILARFHALFSQLIVSLNSFVTFFFSR